ncbi:hypothetical protein AAHA92_18055 [Salvia divinorum]|uniref:WRC domain-containing protein n=1 Tax=Salvia divinorum TaxID=28513 RepID=A0ABD1H219_SALDI
MRIRKRFSPTPPLSDLRLPPCDPPNDIWAFLKTEEKMKQKEFGDDDRMNTNNDIRKIVSICHGEEDSNTNMQPPSSSLQGRCCVESYKLVPLKKRKGVFERNPSEEGAAAKMKSKTNKKYGDVRKEKGKSKRGNVIMEGSRCSRVNGRGWRCCQATLVGYSLCEHHLGKGRLRTKKPNHHQNLLTNNNKSRKVGVVKARSISSLLRQI